MKEIVSKFSFYDILAMVIPGGTILVYINIVLGNLLIFDNTKADIIITWIIVLVVSYMLGLINQTITLKMWKSFRNNSYMLNKALEAASRKNKGVTSKLIYIKYCIRKTEDQYIDCKVDLIYIIIKHIILCLGLGVVTLFVIDKLSCHIGWSAIVFPIAIVIFIILFTSLSENIEGNNKITHFYYVAYYYAIQRRYSNDIPILEAQVAFLQNMIIPLMLLFIVPIEMTECYFTKDTYWILHILLFITVTAIFFTVFYRQDKIYQRVWEDYEFL